MSGLGGGTLNDPPLPTAPTVSPARRINLNELARPYLDPLRTIATSPFPEQALGKAKDFLEKGQLEDWEIARNPWLVNVVPLLRAIDAALTNLTPANLAMVQIIAQNMEPVPLTGQPTQRPLGTPSSYAAMAPQPLFMTPGAHTANYVPPPPPASAQSSPSLTAYKPVSPALQPLAFALPSLDPISESPEPPPPPRPAVRLYPNPAPPAPAPPDNGGGGGINVVSYLAAGIRLAGAAATNLIRAPFGDAPAPLFPAVPPLPPPDPDYNLAAYPDVGPPPSGPMGPEPGDWSRVPFEAFLPQSDTAKFLTCLYSFIHPEPYEVPDLAKSEEDLLKLSPYYGFVLRAWVRMRMVNQRVPDVEIIAANARSTLWMPLYTLSAAMARMARADGVAYAIPKNGMWSRFQQARLEERNAMTLAREVAIKYR